MKMRVTALARTRIIAAAHAVVGPDLTLPPGRTPARDCRGARCARLAMAAVGLLNSAHVTATLRQFAARLDDRRLRGGGGAGGVRGAAHRALSRSGGDPPAARRRAELRAGAEGADAR